MKIFYFIIMTFFALVGCDNQNDTKQQKNSGVSSPAQVTELKKGQNWHLVATEKNVFLATDLAIYRKRVGTDGWTRTAMTVRDGSKIVSVAAVRRQIRDPYTDIGWGMSTSYSYWAIYILMDSGNLFAVREGDEDDPQEIQKIKTPE